MGVLNLMQGQKAAASAVAEGRASATRKTSLQMHTSASTASAASRKSTTMRAAAWADDSTAEQFGYLDKKILDLKYMQEEHMADLENSVEHKFNLFMGGVIIVNIVYIALEIDFGPEEGTSASERVGWMFCSTVFLIIFAIEVITRMYWERLQWLRGIWNWFDATVLLCGIVDVWVLTFMEGKFGSMQALSALRLARLVRLLRMIKLIKNLHGLYVIVMAFIEALQSMVLLGCMMFFGMLIYAIFATMLIGRNSAFDHVRINGDTVDDRFGKVYRSMYSLFELMTLEGWEQVARPLVVTQPLVFLFIGSYILIFTYGMLNMVVATVVEKTLAQHNKMKQLDHSSEMLNIMCELSCMKDLFETNGSITQNEFSNALRTNTNLREAFERLGVPTRNAIELFTILDCNGDHEVSIKELVEGVARIATDEVSPWHMLATYAGVQTLKVQLDSLKELSKSNFGSKTLETISSFTRSAPVESSLNMSVEIKPKFEDFPEAAAATPATCSVASYSQQQPQLEEVMSNALEHIPEGIPVPQQILALSKRQAQLQTDVEKRFDAQDQVLAEILSHVRLLQAM